MADVRFLILCGPPSLDSSSVGFPPAEPRDPVDALHAAVSAPTGRIGHSGVRRAPARRRSGESNGATSDGWWFAWRLMASNNRRLARGVTSFTSRPNVVDAITRLKSEPEGITAQVLTDPQNGSWGWRAEFDGIAVAACPHRYERERDCRTGFGRFIDAIPRALLADGAMILRDRRGPAPAIFTIEEPRRWPA
ncbi:MAG TPA: hypothetical protein VH352_20895 [Pseudonocardiaceae bacterium]|jgi:hypothetical protein|nr:hypothetical protein [Pseudonocardiaceae bacterium]